MSLNEALGGVVADADSVAERLERDLEASTGVAHSVTLQTVQDRARKSTIYYTVQPDHDALVAALQDADESYYEGVDVDTQGGFNLQITLTDDSRTPDDSHAPDDSYAPFE